VNSNKIEELKAIVADETIAQDKRDEAARVLAELEQQPMNIFDATVAKIKREYEERTGQPFPKAR
jgi:hypothetical protein